MSTDQKKLISKIQYNHFETGEFVDEKERSYEEVISLIENFPWEEQRNNDLLIDLSSPSITIQDDDRSYLRISLYRDNKFILYFYDGKSLYSKIVLKFTDAYEDIDEYMALLSPDLTHFKKEDTTFKSPEVHFRSKDFIYKVDPNNPGAYITANTWVLLLLLTACLIVLISTSYMIGIGMTLFLSAVLLFAFGPINLFLTANYFSHSKGKMLQLSKGSSTFKYGDVGNPVEYNKSDIADVTVERNTSTRCTWNEFTVTTIKMKNGDVFKIPSILLKADSIDKKLPVTKVTTKAVFAPFI